MLYEQPLVERREIRKTVKLLDVIPVVRVCVAQVPLILVFVRCVALQISQHVRIREDDSSRVPSLFEPSLRIIRLELSLSVDVPQFGLIPSPLRASFADVSADFIGTIELRKLVNEHNVAAVKTSASN
jgi:hypothetical protein